MVETGTKRRKSKDIKYTKEADIDEVMDKVIAEGLRVQEEKERCPGMRKERNCQKNQTEKERSRHQKLGPKQMDGYKQKDKIAKEGSKGSEEIVKPKQLMQTLKWMTSQQEDPEVD